MRLDKLISNSGFGSRKEIKNLLKSGSVTVNNIIAKSPDIKVDPEKDELYINGERLIYRPFIYLMLNKPAGVVSATYDNRDATVLSLVPEHYSHYELFPVGRLDKDTEGLLIITNDGDLAHRLLSPKKHVPKRYFAKINVPVTQSDIAAFNEGVILDDGYKTMPAELCILNDPVNIEVVLHEGKFHQVKRMFEAVGKKVLYLKRISFGDINLDNSLKLSKIRELTEDEILKLKSSV